MQGIGNPNCSTERYIPNGMFKAAFFPNGMFRATFFRVALTLCDYGKSHKAVFDGGGYRVDFDIGEVGVFCLLDD